MSIVLSMIAFSMFMSGIRYVNTSKSTMMLMFICGSTVSSSAGIVALFDFKSMWTGAIFAFSPICITAAIWWFTQKHKSITTTTLFLIGLMLIGCDNTIPPENGDVIVGVAKVEDLVRTHTMSGAYTSSFRTHSENRILIFNQGPFSIAEQSESLKNEDEIRIIKRGQQYYWTTGGRLVPFD